jgi:hypothetical protein
MLCIDLKELNLEKLKLKDCMAFISDNSINTILGGPGSSIHGNSYWSTIFINSILRSKIRKDKIKRIFNVNREEK